ncbi:hypothetical protein SCALIN_C45_0124 [Candidatus Scalindua japonica]|uniref:Uncharacterized protein n=1 Tax=Candidatus Scalindua japonica TaxID=1284222 RepID=A0A286U4B6_9BACT|nr:DUF5647 family protein [Candidatus Scalindua japonica]GAX62966.1 hypothetical protein SCALIN_C45_0124 [Candidatus Scalindua japonica]
MNIMEKKNTDLIKEFNRYMREHPDIAESIPNNAVIIMQLEGDEGFNKWSNKMAREHMEKDQSVVYIRIKKIKPLISRIEELEIEPHAVY